MLVVDRPLPKALRGCLLTLFRDLIHLASRLSSMLLLLLFNSVFSTSGLAESYSSTYINPSELLYFYAQMFYTELQQYS